MKKSIFYSILDRIRSAIDINPLPPQNPISNKSDEEVLKGDWETVCNNFKVIFRKISEEYQQHGHDKKTVKP